MVHRYLAGYLDKLSSVTGVPIYEFSMEACENSIFQPCGDTYAAKQLS